MAFETILYEVKEGYAILTFNRPDQYNALNEKMKVEISEVLDMAVADETVRGLIITGAGKGFMAGTDLKEIPDDRTGADTIEMSRHGQELMNKIEKLPIPVIAAINGYALGGGTELALACDLRTVGEKGVFGLPESDIGVAPCYGGTQRLARLCGPAIAKDLLLTARKVRAQEAFDLGLANRIFPQETLLAETEELMKSIVKNAPIALRVCKQLVDEGLNMSMEDGLKLEADLNGMLAETEDAKEGVLSFKEKRKPVFKNR